MGWNWTNSRSVTSAPARIATATPSPVDTDGLVVAANTCPSPPVASSESWNPTSHSTGGATSTTRVNLDLATIADGNHIVVVHAAVSLDDYRNWTAWDATTV